MLTETYKAKDGYRWRVRAKNGRIIAESGEAYVSASNARRAFDRLLELIGDEPLCGDLPESTLGSAAQSNRVH